MVSKLKTTGFAGRGGSVTGFGSPSPAECSSPLRLWSALPRFWSHALTATGRAAHPLVVLALLLVGVITLDTVGRGVVVLVRRVILDGRLRRHP